MTQCNHKDCDVSSEIYLQTAENNGIRPYKYCIHCGTLHEIGGKRLGYFEAILSDLRNIYDLKDVQVRLILKEIESFDDKYGYTFDMQRKEFIRVVLKFTTINETVLETFI